MKPTITVETKRFEAALRRLAQETGKSFVEVVNQNARLIAVNLAYQTQPFGLGLDAKKAGEGAVFRDIGKVFKPANKIYAELRAQSAKMAKGFYAAVKNGDFAQAEDILRRSGILDRNAEIGELQPELHRKSRNRRGRVSRHRAALITPDAKSIRDYQKQVAQKVGFAKGGWIAAGQQLGKLSRVPAWLKKNAGQQGKATRRGGERNPSVELHNLVRYVSQVLTPAQMAEALRIQREKMEKHINYVVSKAARRQGIRVTGNQGAAPPAP